MDVGILNEVGGIMMMHLVVMPAIAVLRIR